VTAMYQLVEPGNAGRHPRRRIERRRPIAALRARRLDAPVHLDALSVDDPEGMAAHLITVPARFHDLDRSSRRALDVLHPEPDDRIGDRFFVQQDGPTAVQRYRLNARTAGRFPPCRP